MASQKAVDLMEKPPLDVPERAVHMVFVTIFIDILAATISTPVMPFYAKMFGATTAQITFLFAAWSFCSTVFAPILGKLSDSWGRRPILILALVGAGCSNIFQGLSKFAIPVLGASYAFYVFGLFRACSGIFAAIGTVTNVYIQDVVPKPLLPDYMSKMQVVGPMAFIFGPGMGGGLASIGGAECPVLVDGLITLLSAILVSLYLPETPAFLKLKASREESKQESNIGVGDRSADAAPKLEWQVYVMSCAAFFGGLTMSAFVSMQAIYLNEVYHLDVLHVTYVSVGSAVTLVLTSLFLSSKVKNALGLRWTVVVANSFGGLLYFFQASCAELGFSVWFFVVAVWLNSAQSSIAGSVTAPLLAEFTTTANRGKVNSTSQLLMNLGRMIGPLVYGQLASFDISYVWVIAGVALLIKAFLTSFVQPKSAAAPKPIQRANSAYGVDWQDEVGGPEDERAIGKLVSNLLTKGHYKWISRRSEIEGLLEQLLPELSVESKESYEAQFHALEMAAHDIHATTK